MNQCFYRYVISACLLLCQSLSAQTIWTGNFSKNWNQANNWTNGLPGPFNEPTITTNPVGGVFPEITVLTYFNFNVQNYGVINVSGDGGVSLFGIFINHPNATVSLNSPGVNFLVESVGDFENYGKVTNDGTFNNEGLVTNNLNAVFDNNHLVSHSAGSFQNLGHFNNLGEFYSEAQFFNTGDFNNHNLFNNNKNAVNQGTFNVFAGALLRNDLNFDNKNPGTLSISGSFLNNHVFQNFSQVMVNAGGTITNSYLTRNTISGNWNNQGNISNVFCAIFENKGTDTNNSVFENEGIVYADTPIAPQAPSNMGSGVVIAANNFGSLCHDYTVSLPLSGPAVVQGLDLANDQLDFCMGWTILINGNPSVSYIGCASLGQHDVTVTFTDPFGRVTSCPAKVTVIDDLAPSISCQPTQTVPLTGGQCTASPNLFAPTIVQENCTVGNITNTAPAIFQIGTTQIVWTVTDLNGNSASCQQSIVVVDQEPPLINCPTDLSLDVAPNTCGISSLSTAITSNPATATDNCSVPMVSNNAGAILPVGINTITWKATDAYGNASFCQQQVTVVDNLPPVINSCPSDLTVQSQLAGCQANVIWGQAVTTDNCGATTQTFSTPNGSIYNLGTTPVIVTVTDASANTATCQFNVTVVDTQSPLWSNCPGNTTITLLDCGDVAVGNWQVPIASDPCLSAVTSNFQPGDVLPLGNNQVTYTAIDSEGNASECSFTINVTAQMAMTCPPDILVNVGLNETSSSASWNTPPGVTNCTVCASTDISGFLFLGEKSGHRYYVYLGGGVSWADAKSLSTQHGGYLASVSDFSENELLRKELPSVFHDAWLGLTDQSIEGQFVWENGEPVSFTNWLNGAIPQHDALDFGVFRKDGLWFDDEPNGLHTFLMEIPCYSIEILSSDANALNSMVFPLGNTTISYEYTDNCGNACYCDFKVQVVQNQQINPCFAVGNSAYGWIEKVQTEGFSNDSGDDGGRGDYTNSVFKLPDPGCILKLSAGGPATDSYLYWRIWADLNMDGDFFDDNEELGSLEGVGEQDFCYDVLANLPTGPVGLRIAMSRWDYAAVCGNFIAGESEDYVVEFVDSSLFNPTNCYWNFGLFNGVLDDLQIKLNWLGTGNCNVAYFQVERSADGLQFDKIAEVSAQTVNQPPALYHFDDRTPFYGKNYYRIRTVMDDSSAVSSSVFETDYSVDFEDIFVYPNPATTDMILHVYPFNGLPAYLFIADAKGQIVDKRTYDILDNEAIKFELSNYTPGIYTIYLKADGRREQVRRFMVSRH